MRFVVFVTLLLATLPALAGGFGPWSFGMSADDIRAVESHGPYRAFSNGDLETYNADFGGKKQNVQFYLENDVLWRIAIRTYEGTDLVKATQTWMDTYTTLKDLYGEMEAPGLSGETLVALAESAESLVTTGGKAQMAPLTQPEGKFVFSSFNSTTHEGITYYGVTVNYDPPAP